MGEGEGITGLPIASAREVRRSAVRLIRADPRGFAATIVLGVSAAVLALVPPWLVGVIVDRVQHGTTPADVDRFGVALVVLAIMQTLLSRFSVLVTARFGERSSRRLRREMVDRVLALPPRIADTADTGDLVVRSTTDVQRVTGILSNAVPEMLIPIVQVVLTFAFIVVLSPLLALTTIVGLLGIVAATRWYLHRAARAYLAQAADYAGLTENLTATISGARTVELYGLQQRRMHNRDELANRSRRSQLATLRLRSVLFPAIDSSYALALVLVLLVGAAMFFTGIVGLGALVAVLLYVRQLAAPMDTVLLWLESLQSGIASFARVEGLGSAVGTSVASDSVPAGSDIAVTDVTFRYGEGPMVLDGVSLDVVPGENLAIVGATGAGKTTLARLLVGIEQPTTGSVTIGGVEASTLAIETRRSHLALVSQDQHIFADTVRNNLLLARPTAGDDELHSALRAVGGRWVTRLPYGLDTEIGGAYALTGADAQQLALARIILADPETVVLDEATSLLDPGAARETERSLASILQGRTVIAIAHRLSTARDADRIAMMHEGEIRELGSHDELVQRNGLYAHLWRVWHMNA